MTFWRPSIHAMCQRKKAWTPIKTALISAKNLRISWQFLRRIFLHETRHIIVENRVPLEVPLITLARNFLLSLKMHTLQSTICLPKKSQAPQINLSWNWDSFCKPMIQVQFSISIKNIVRKKTKPKILCCSKSIINL